MKIVKVSIVGCGRISNHYKDILISNKIKNFKVVATCDLKSEQAIRMSTFFNCPHYTSLKEMINKIKIDLILLLTPSGLHFQNSKYILKNKINLLIEKPTSFFPKEIKTLDNLAKKNNLIAATAYQNRYNPSIQFLKKCIEEKKFGKIVTASVRLRWCRYNSYYEDDWHGKWKMDGGVTNQQAIHHLDCLDWLIGPVKKVVSLGTKRINKLEAEDTLVAIGEFKQGGLFTVEVTTAARPRDFEASLSIVGEKGLIEIGGIGLNKIEKCEFVDKKIKFNEIKKLYSEKIKNGYGLSHIILLKKIITNIINKNISSPVPIDSTIRTCELINAIYKSNETKKWINVNNKNISTKLGRC